MKTHSAEHSNAKRLFILVIIIRQTHQPVKINKANTLDHRWHSAVYQNPMINLHISVQAAESAENNETNSFISHQRKKVARRRQRCHGEVTPNHQRKKDNPSKPIHTYTFDVIDDVDSLLVNCYQNGNVLLLEKTHKTSNWLFHLAVVEGSTVGSARFGIDEQRRAERGDRERDEKDGKQ